MDDRALEQAAADKLAEAAELKGAVAEEFKKLLVIALRAARSDGAEHMRGRMRAALMGLEMGLADQYYAALVEEIDKMIRDLPYPG